jgi:hypothetical protein
MEEFKEQRPKFKEQSSKGKVLRAEFNEQSSKFKEQSALAIFHK